MDSLLEQPLSPWSLVRLVVTVKITGEAGVNLGDVEFISGPMNPILAEVLLRDLKDARVVKARKLREPEP
jgi:hypothetical protein